MITFTVTHDNAHTGVLADYSVVTSGEFAEGTLDHWEWMSQVQEEQEQALAHTGEEGAILLVWKADKVVAGLALGNAIID